MSSDAVKRDSLGVLGPLRAVLPWLELHGESFRRPLFSHPGEEAHVLVELDRSLFHYKDDPRVGDVVFGDGKSVRARHEHMFACSVENFCTTQLMIVNLEERALLTKEEAAQLLRVKPRTLWSWGAEGRLEVVHLTARTLRYTATSVAALMEAAGEPDRAVHQESIAPTEVLS